MISGYVNDINGILVWNQASGNKAKGHWSGAVRDGYASGEGILTWYQHQKEIASYIGYMKHGKPEGFGICKFVGGHIYAGQWKSGCRNGKGKYWFGDGRYYSGLWLNDKKVKGITST